MIEHLSVSSVDMFLRCGEQFRRRYIEGEIIPPGIAARVGTGLHKGAEANSKEKISTGHDAPLSVVQDAARDGYVKAVQSGIFVPAEQRSEAKTLLAQGLDDSVKLATLYREEVAPDIMPVAAEKQIVAEVPGLSVPVLGYIDTVTDADEIRDLKSAGKAWPKNKPHGEHQPTVYAFLFEYIYGRKPSRFVYDILVNGKKESATYMQMETMRDEADFAAWVRIAQTVLRSISAGVFPPAAPGSFLCSPNFCGYHSSCPYINQKRYYSIGG